MAIRLSPSNFLVRQRAPVSRIAAPLAQRLPVWPTVSIVVLLCFSVILPPIVVTVMNGTLVGLAAAVVLLANRSIDRTLFYVGVPFVLMVTAGLISGTGSARYVYFKDAWYVINPLLVILAGYILYLNKPDLGRGLRAFVIGGLIIAIFQMRAYFVSPDIILLPAETIRRLIGAGFYAPVAAVVILLFYAGRWGRDLKIPGWLAALLLLVIGTAVAGVFSRTALMVVVVGVAALAGCFARREWLRLLLPLLILGVFAYSMQLVVDVDSDQSIKTFGGKLARTLHELTVSDYAGLRDINLSFRGYETARALDQYAAGSVFQLIFGQGFGAAVDLRVFLPLEFNEAGERVNVRHITALHNGYAFLLIKAGAIGTAAYLFVLGYLYLLGRPTAGLPLSHPESRPGRLLQAMVVTLATTTYIVSGAFSKQDMFPFLLLTGYLIAHLRSPATAIEGGPG